MAVEAAPAEVLRLLGGGVVRVLDTQVRPRVLCVCIVVLWVMVVVLWELVLGMVGMVLVGRVRGKDRLRGNHNRGLLQLDWHIVIVLGIIICGRVVQLLEKGLLWLLLFRRRGHRPRAERHRIRRSTVKGEHPFAFRCKVRLPFFIYNNRRSTISDKARVPRSPCSPVPFFWVPPCDPCHNALALLAAHCHCTTPRMSRLYTL